MTDCLYYLKNILPLLWFLQIVLCRSTVLFTTQNKSQVDENVHKTKISINLLIRCSGFGDL